MLALLAGAVSCRDDRCMLGLVSCEPSTEAAPLCVDPRSNWNHCGACFRHCAIGQRCVEGRCALFSCESGRMDCVDPFTRRECAADGRQFAVYPCPADTVCAAGRCRAWPSEEAWVLVEQESFEQPPDLPDWLSSLGRCASIDETTVDGARALRFVGPLYARRALRFGQGEAHAAEVRFRALGSERGELALFARAGNASSGIAGAVRVRVEGSSVRVRLANDRVVYERAADASPIVLRVEQDRARDRLRVLVGGSVVGEVALSAFLLIGSHFQVKSDAPCGEATFEVDRLRTWSAP